MLTALAEATPGAGRCRAGVCAVLRGSESGVRLELQAGDRLGYQRGCEHSRCRRPDWSGRRGCGVSRRRSARPPRCRSGLMSGACTISAVPPRALNATKRTFAAAWAAGRAMPLEQAIAYALEDAPVGVSRNAAGLTQLAPHKHLIHGLMLIHRTCRTCTPSRVSTGIPMIAISESRPNKRCRVNTA